MYDFIIVNKFLPFDVNKFVKMEYSYINLKNLLKPKKRLLMRFVILFFVALLLLIFRLKIMGFSKPNFKPHDNPASFMDLQILRVLNYNYIYFLNIWLLICPEWLCFDWSMGCIPLINDYDLRIVNITIFWLVFGSMLKIVIFSNLKKNHHLRYLKEIKFYFYIRKNIFL